MIRRIARDGVFLRTLAAIALPIALQNLIASGLNMVDTIMIGQLGDTRIAAVGLANQITFLLHLFLFGISSGSAIFTAQYWGIRDQVNIRRILGLGLVTSLAISSVFALGGLLGPSLLLGLFSSDPAVLDQGSRYLVIVAWSYPMMAVSFTYAGVLRSTGDARLPMYISAFALLLNTGLNYLLINGRAGFPALGVSGAAWATLTARSVEICAMLLVVYWRRGVLAARPAELCDWTGAYIRRFFRTASPVILNESLWAVGVTMYVIVYARMGTDVVASINIAATAERLALVVFFGIASAAGIMLGNLIGAGDPDLAFRYAKRFAVLGPLFGLLAGALLILAAPWVVSFYKVSPAAAAAARGILLVYGLVAPFRVFNIINIVGILRSGGDTRFALFLDTAGVWLIAVPLAFLGGLVWGLPVQQVVMLIVIEEGFKVTLGLRRLLSRRWINRLVGEPARQIAADAE
jgi:putative MATE family efflux protein